MKINRQWFLLMCAVGIIISNFFFGDPKSGNVISLFFSNLLPVFLVWLGYVNFVRVSWKSNFGVFAFLMLISSGILSDYISYRRELANTMSAIENLTTLAKGLKDGNLEEAEYPKTSENDSPFEKIAIRITQFVKEGKKISDKYNTELDAIGWNQILDIKRLSADENLQKSEFMVERAFQFASVYKQSIENLSNAYLNDIEELFKKQKWDSLDPDLLRENAAIVQQICNYELEIVNEVASLVQHLKKTRKQWYAENDQILFTNGSALKKYNDILLRIQDVVSAQNQLKVESQKKGQEQLNKFLKEK